VIPIRIFYGCSEIVQVADDIGTQRPHSGIPAATHAMQMTASIIAGLRGET
jgi:hypothetical protein